MKFDGKTSWYVPNMNSNRSSSYPISDLWDKDFTYCFRFKVDWESMIVKDKWNVGGIVVRNGAHFGVNAVVGIDGEGKILKAFESTVWTSNTDKINNAGFDYVDPDKNKCQSIKIDSNNSVVYYSDVGEHDGKKETINWDGWMNCCFVNEYNSGMTLYIDDYEGSLFYDTQMLNYSDSWLWMGCCNGFITEEENNYFAGEISHIGLFQKAFGDKDRQLFFENLDNLSSLNNYDLNPITLSDFEKITPYKVYDLSENGNHFTLYDEEWASTVWSP
jgi:hypothetical protein